MIAATLESEQAMSRDLPFRNYAVKQRWLIAHTQTSACNRESRTTAFTTNTARRIASRLAQSLVALEQLRLVAPAGGPLL